MPAKHFIWIMPLLALMLWLPLVFKSMVWLIADIGLITIFALAGMIWGIVEATS